MSQRVDQFDLPGGNCISTGADAHASGASWLPAVACLGGLAALCVVLAFSFGNPPVISAAQAPAGAKPAARPTFDFKKSIRPLFEKYCVECHSGSAPEAGLDLKLMLD